MKAWRAEAKIFLEYPWSYLSSLILDTAIELIKAAIFAIMARTSSNRQYRFHLKPIRIRTGYMSVISANTRRIYFAFSETIISTVIRYFSTTINSLLLVLVRKCKQINLRVMSSYTKTLYFRSPWNTIRLFGRNFNEWALILPFLLKTK